MECRKTFPAMTILFLIFISLAVPVVCADNGDPIVGMDDEYQKDIKMGDTGRFNWTVYTNSSKNYVVTVDVEGFKKWDQKVSPSYFVLDEEDPYKIVTLSFHVPKYPEKRSRDATVTFTFRELNGTSSFDIEKSVEVDVKDITPASNENTILGGFQNPLPEPLNKPYGAFLLNIAIWSIIALIFYSIISPIIHSFTKKTKTEFDDNLVGMIRRPTLLLIILYGLIDSFLRMNVQIRLRATIYQFYWILVVVIGIYVTYNIFLGTLKEVAAQRGGEGTTFSQVLEPVLEKIGGIVIVLVGLMIVFKVMGIQITGLLAGAGIIGLVIAFAAQDTLSNFFSGLHLLLDRPFRIGDVILIESGEYCRVEKIGMRSTKLYSMFDHELIVLPNNHLANQKIINLVEPDTAIRTNVEVGVAYGSDLDEVKDILIDTLKDHPDVVEEGERESIVRFSEFGDSSLKFNLRFWVKHYMDQWKVASDIRERIDTRFKEAKVTIPFPQRTVWMKEEKE
ncbi:MAG: mechanosensitive ion channel family protein [Thermoplasmatota archaeon]